MITTRCYRSSSCWSSERVCPLVDFSPARTYPMNCLSLSVSSRDTCNEPVIERSMGSEHQLHLNQSGGLSLIVWLERRCEQTCALAAYYNPTSKLATSRLASIYLCVNMSLALIEGVMIAMRRTGQEASLMFFQAMSVLIR